MENCITLKIVKFLDNIYINYKLNQRTNDGTEQCLKCYELNSSF